MLGAWTAYQDRPPAWKCALRDLVTWLVAARDGNATAKASAPATWNNCNERCWKLDGTRVTWELAVVRTALSACKHFQPRITRLDDAIVFRVEHLPGSEHGPLIDRDLVRGWAAVSAPAWRTSLRLAYLWDKAKAANNGARIYATRPVVARGAGGVILGADDKPLRDRRGAVVKDWSDPRAVHLGANRKPAGAGNPPAIERNPAADRVPALDPDDLIRLAYDENITRSKRDKRPPPGLRKALRAKEAAGEVATRSGRRRVAYHRGTP